jgi:hypothetical protein
MCSKGGNAISNSFRGVDVHGDEVQMLGVARTNVHDSQDAVGVDRDPHVHIQHAILIGSTNQSYK